MEGSGESLAEGLREESIACRGSTVRRERPFYREIVIVASPRSGFTAFAIAGSAMEIGIEATARHGADLGYIPVVIKYACGFGHRDAAERSLASLEFAGDTLLTSVETNLRSTRTQAITRAPLVAPLCVLSVLRG